MSNLTDRASALQYEGSLALVSSDARAMQLAINHIQQFLSESGDALDQESPGDVTQLGYKIDQLAAAINGQPDPREKNPYHEGWSLFKKTVGDEVESLRPDKSTLVIAAVIVLGVLVLSRQI